MLIGLTTNKQLKLPFPLTEPLSGIAHNINTGTLLSVEPGPYHGRQLQNVSCTAVHVKCPDLSYCSYSCG